MKTTGDYQRAIRRELAAERPQTQCATEDEITPVIELRDVWLGFDRPILRGVNLRVCPGETLVVFGESGVGKSTLLKLILRFLIPDRGQVRVFGREISELSFAEANMMRQRIGMVFQYAALFDSLNIYENVAFALREHTDLREAEIERIVREKLSFVDLDPDQVMPRLPGEISGGMRKRVGIARAIATDPEVILYDEPTAGLDPLAVEAIVRLIRKLQVELGVTSIVVTHDIRAGFRVASRIEMIRQGSIVFEGTPEEMVASDDPYLQAFLS
jgi:phospholipid/cholesterol/gamma-HCH transport system ATP-binding protein